MFKKISIATARSARPLLAAFSEDLKPKAKIDVPQAWRKQFLAAIKTPGFKADIGETVFNDRLIIMGMGSRAKLDAAAARRGRPLSASGARPRLTRRRRTGARDSTSPVQKNCE